MGFKGQKKSPWIWPKHDDDRAKLLRAPCYSLRKVYPATGRASNPTHDPRSPAGRREPRLPFSACFDRPTPLSPPVPQTPPPLAHPQRLPPATGGESSRAGSGRRRGAAVEDRPARSGGRGPARSGGSGSVEERRQWIGVACSAADSM